MSNHNRLCRDLIGGSLQIKSKTVLDQDANLRAADAKVTNLIVREDVTVCGDSTLKGNVAVCGDLTLKTGEGALSFCTKVGQAVAPGAGGDNVQLIDVNTGLPMVLNAGETVLGVSGAGTAVAPTGLNYHMHVRVWGDAALDTSAQDVLGEDSIVNTAVSSHLQYEDWNQAGGVWGYPCDGLSQIAANVGYLGVTTHGDDWESGTVSVKVTVAKIPMCD